MFWQRTNVYIMDDALAMIYVWSCPINMKTLSTYRTLYTFSTRKTFFLCKIFKEAAGNAHHLPRIESAAFVFCSARCALGQATLAPFSTHFIVRNLMQSWGSAVVRLQRKTEVIIVIVTCSASTRGLPYCQKGKSETSDITFTHGTLHLFI